MHTKKKFGTQLEISTVLIFIFLGSLLGAIIANNINKIYLDSVIMSTKNFFYNLSQANINKANLFTLEFIKNLKIILFLWIMGFIPFGNLFLYFILFVKGLSYGFSSSIIFNIYKSKGFFYILKFILPTSLILLPIIIFVSVYSTKFSSRLRYISKKDLKKNIFEYIFLFIIAGLCVFLCALINLYIAN